MTNYPGDQPEPQAGAQQPYAPQQYGQPGQWPQHPGYGQYGYGAPLPQPPGDGQGVAAMVVGIVALAGACAYGLGTILSPVALFLGRSSMKRIDASGGRLGGRGMAQAGFILGIIGTVLLVLAIAFWGIIIAVGVSGGFE